MTLPFSVFYRSDRHSYYVAFKNEETGKYLPAISTKKKKEADAVKQAWLWYREGIPHKNGTLDLKARSLRDSIRHSTLTSSDAEFIIEELKRRGLVVSCIFAGAPDAVRLDEFLSEIWDFDRSPYIREKLRAEHSIHRNYANQMLGTVKKHWIPFFGSVLLGSLLPNDLERFADSLTELSLSNVRKNTIIKAGTIPLRWAYRKKKINQDITQGLMLFSGSTNERPILTPDLAASIFEQEWADERSKVANITAMVTGLRAGELQGLLYGDLGEDCLFIRHSWNPLDKLKGTKNNTPRIVEIPFASVLNSLRYIAENNPHGVNKDSYVFWASRVAHKPIEQKLFRSGLRSALVKYGLSKEQAAGYDFHAWRHYFTTYMKDRIEDKLLQTQTGHKSLVMLRRYSDHLKAGDRDKIRQAQIEVFASLLPSG